MDSPSPVNVGTKASGLRRNRKTPAAARDLGHAPAVKAEPSTSRVSLLTALVHSTTPASKPTAVSSSDIALFRLVRATTPHPTKPGMTLTLLHMIHQLTLYCVAAGMVRNILVQAFGLISV